MKLFRILFLLLLFQSALLYPQSGKFSYNPSNLDSLKTYINAITAKQSTKFAGPNQKEISKILTDRKESFLKTIADSSYIFDSRINNYLKSVLHEIYSANPAIDTHDFYFFVNKSPVPNAAAYGNGIFTINLGLLDLLESDDQIAFAICHEIAHFILKHNDVSLVQYVQTMNSKDTKKKINKAVGQRYGKRQAVYDVMRDLQYNFLKRSRTAEMQADSLGYVYLSRTKYNKIGAPQTLRKLESSDSLLFTTDTNIRKHFNFDAYPFKEQWMQGDETLFDLKEKSDDMAFDKDSLKTHPDIPFRLSKLGLSLNESVAVTSDRLTEAKKASAQNMVAIALDDSRLDLALYLILAMHENNAITNEVYCESVASLLKKTYELKAGHRFGKYVQPVSPFSDEKYLNEVRIFLHNMELKNIRKIGLQFCLLHQSEMASNTEFGNLTKYFSDLNL